MEALGTPSHSYLASQDVLDFGNPRSQKLPVNQVQLMKDLTDIQRYEPLPSSSRQAAF